MYKNRSSYKWFLVQSWMVLLLLLLVTGLENSITIIPFNQINHSQNERTTINYQEEKERRGTNANLFSMVQFVSAQTVQIKTLNSMYEGYCILFTNGEVKCWGNGGDGRLGSGSTNNIGDASGEMGYNLPSLQFGTGFVVDEIATGNYHGCALSTDKKIKCWGLNYDGQLGIGSNNNVGDVANEMGDNLPFASVGTDSTPLHVHCLGATTCIHFTNNKVKCFGTIWRGAHGQGTGTQYGGSLTRIGDNIPYINIGTSRTVKSVHTSYIAYSVCVIMDNDALKCWGANDYGQLGLGDTTDRGNMASDMGDRLPEIDLGTERNALSLSVGMINVCAFLNTNEVVCWGGTTFGELALGISTNIGDESGEMGFNIPTPSLGTSRTITMSVCGENHRCYVLDNNTVKCVGTGENGKLGYGDTVNRGTTSGTIGNNLSPVDLGTSLTITHIAGGANSNCVAFDNIFLKCWGYGERGSLGNEGTASYGASPNTMGKNLRFVRLGLPTTAPTKNPTNTPTKFPTNTPTKNPTSKPSLNPTKNPSRNPTINPTKYPTASPTQSPTRNPTENPTVSPTQSPTRFPTRSPTSKPSLNPTPNPSKNPTINPTKNPTDSPSSNPSASPSSSPSLSPSPSPTLSPSFFPSKSPTNGPTFNPSITPTKIPTTGPTFNPTPNPSISPTPNPSRSPTISPTKNPTINPTSSPSRFPSNSPISNQLINPTRNPTKSPIPPTKSPSKLPTSTPTNQCDYTSAKLCKNDIKCKWKKVDSVKQCVVFDCISLNKGKCKKEKAKCKWNKKEKLCNFKK